LPTFTFRMVQKGEGRGGRVFIENWVKMGGLNEADQPLKGSLRIGGGEKIVQSRADLGT
jgi:hypothetical protein